MRFVLLFFIACFALAEPMNKCAGVENFSESQKEVILYAYNYGKKYDLGYTLAAIAWHESCAGEYKMNFADPSAGLYHAWIPGIIKRYKFLSDTSFNRNVIGSLLAQDDEFASKAAIDELMYWDKVRGGNWKNIIKSYNKGTKWDSSATSNQLAENYYNSVSSKVEILQRYIPTIINQVKIKERPPMLSQFNGAGSENLKEASVVEKIRKIEVVSMKNYDKNAIKDAKRRNKAVISIYNKDGENITHEKTVILNPVYVNK